MAELICSMSLQILLKVEVTYSVFLHMQALDAHNLIENNLALPDVESPFFA